MLAYIFLILACVCFMCEMMTLEFSLTCVGIGFLAAAYGAYLGWNILWLLFLFAAVALTLWLTIRPLALRFLYRNSKQIKTPAQNVIGKQAVVEIAIDPIKMTGRVKVEGESWKAAAKEPLKEGTVCVVEKLEGVTLFVTKKI